MEAIVHPGFAGGILTAPTSKSDAHRALICAALADNGCTLHVGARNADIDATLRCLEALGASFAFPEEDSIQVTPIGTPENGGTADCGESGSTLRFMLPVAAALGTTTDFIGSGKLPERPLSELVGALTAHNSIFSSDHLPLRISGKLTAGCFCLPGNISSQYVTGLLFALPILDGDSEICLTSPLQSVGYVDMTLRTMARFGVTVQATDTGWRISGNQRYHAPEGIRVEGDWSGAAFPLAMGALCAPVTVENLHMDSAQPDRAIIDLLRRFGAKVEQDGTRFTVSPAELSAQTIDVGEIPDLAPILAVVAACAKGVSRLENAARVRLKECDRLAAATQILTAMGVRVTEYPDALEIEGSSVLHGACVEGFNDHRMVMAATAAALRADGETRISDAHAVRKSYPHFFDDFKKLGGKAHVV